MRCASMVGSLCATSTSYASQTNHERCSHQWYPPRTWTPTARKSTKHVKLWVCNATGNSLDTEYQNGRNVAFQEEPLLLPAPSDDSEETLEREAVLEETKQFLETELRQLWGTGNLRRERFADSFSFEDPIAKYSGLDTFLLNLRALRTLFNISYDLHSIETDGPAGLVTRWTVSMQPKVGLWRPAVVVTGRSSYSVDVFAGRLTSRKDYWDAVQNNRFLSLEGIAHVVQQLTNMQTTPNLDTPAYKVLKKTLEYEVRKYEDYLVAETSMPVGAGAAAGEGFQELAGYIFGGNNRRSSMEMTTPVFTTAGQQGPQADRMQFPMERKYGTDPDILPAPNSARILRKLQPGKTVAATQFSGLPLDWEVTAAERKLRAALLLDGLKPEDGYRLARYNDPFTLPMLRRNEVIVELQEFELA